MSAAEELLSALALRGWTVGTAESLTGGLVVAALVDVPGASAHVRGGVVAYSTDLKAEVLGVDEGLLARTGAVDASVAGQMAAGVRRVLGADVGIATTGVAGPDSADGHPVGTVFVAVVTPAAESVTALHLEGSREDIRAQTVRRALQAALSEVRASAG
ncbi:MAG: nicotinamide-nucleotide amidohydrolase family protein [Microbacterium sp.]